MSERVNMVVVAHPDDEILGFGASGYSLVEKGEIVVPVILSAQVEQRNFRPTDSELYADIISANTHVGFNNPHLGSFPNLSMNTVPHVNVVSFIEKIISDVQPSRIFTHHPSDLNNDHKIVSEACQVAIRLSQRTSALKHYVKELYFMEINSSTDWSLPHDLTQFAPNCFFEISDQALEKKLQSMHMYRGVMRDYPHSRSEEALTALAIQRGAQSGLNKAEAFQLVFKRNF